MERYNFEKTIGEIDWLIKEHEKRENTFTMSVLQTCREYAEELKRMKDAEEQGLLLRLKVKPGDSLYKPNPITLKEIVEIRIESIFITESGINISGRTTKMKYSFCCSPSVIGITVFLTYEEAEAALAEKGGVE